MTLEETIEVVRTHLARMQEIYRKPVFDEWAVVAMLGNKGRALCYEGPRREEFHREFNQDAQAFAADLRRTTHNLGDFDFSRHGVGTRFDAFVVVGDGLFLICNNTRQSMATITQDPLWLSAQVPFVELSDVFRSKPLIYPM
jgi:hypothetical protein